MHVPFAGLGEAERRAAAPDAIAAYRAATRTFETLMATSSEALLALQVRLLGCATPAELRKLGRGAIPFDCTAAYPVLADRRPDWLGEWLAWAAEDLDGDGDRNLWRLTRRCVLEGLVERPAGDRYIELMIVGLTGFKGRSVRREVDADPALLDHELWRIFEVEGAPRAGLDTMDKPYHENGGWADMLVEFAERGWMDRARMLDATLGTLARDFGAQRAAWFARLHERLAPTREERAARADAYLGLLGSSVPATVSFAVRALGAVDGLDAAALLAHAGGALASDRKGTVRDALRLLERTAAADDAATCALAAVGALQHPAPDVQARALALIEHWTGGAPGDDVRTALLAYADVVAATARPACDALIAGGAEAARSDGADGASGSAGAAASGDADLAASGRAAGDGARLAALERRAAFVPDAIAAAVGLPAAVAAARAGRPARDLPPMPAPGEPVAGPGDRLEPLADLDALGDLLARVIETGGTAMEIELALDGVSRLCATRAPFDGALRPLRTRARRRATEWPVAALVVAWADGELPPLDVDSYWLPWPIRFVCARAAEVAARAAALTPAPLLATPTYAGGWIEPAALIERVTVLGGPPAPLDLVQALHRLMPAGREAALAAAAPYARAETLAAMRGAVQPGAVELGRPDRWLPAMLDDWTQFGASDPPITPLADALRLVWPGAPEGFFACAAKRLWWQEGAACLAPLVDPRMPLPPSARKALVFGLMNADGATGVAAEEALEAVLPDRLTRDELAGALREGIAWADAKLGRLGKRLTAVAARSPLHAATIRDALGEALAEQHAGRRDLHAVLEPLDELHAAAGAALRAPAARALLARFTGSSKTARLARSLLAREGGPAGGADVALLAAEARLARAERWAADASDATG